MNDNKLETIFKKVHRSREAGFNCAEAVFWGVSQCLDLAVPVSCMTGFGGGVASSGSVCGALCGALAAVGVYVGRTEPKQLEAKLRCTALSEAVAKKFENELGTQLCREILGYLPKNKPYNAPAGINPSCQKAVAVAVKITVQLIGQEQN